METHQDSIRKVHSGDIKAPSRGHRRSKPRAFRTPKDAALVKVQSVTPTSTTLESLIINDVDKKLKGITNLVLLNELKDAVLARWEYKLHHGRTIADLNLPNRLLNPIVSADDFFRSAK